MTCSTFKIQYLIHFYRNKMSVFFFFVHTLLFAQFSITLRAYYLLNSWHRWFFCCALERVANNRRILQRLDAYPRQYPQNRKTRSRPHHTLVEFASLGMSRASDMMSGTSRAECDVRPTRLHFYTFL